MIYMLVPAVGTHKIFKKVPPDSAVLSYNNPLRDSLNEKKVHFMYFIVLLKVSGFNKNIPGTELQHSKILKEQLFIGCQFSWISRSNKTMKLSSKYFPFN